MEEKQKLMVQNTVKVLTIHTAKGLENKNVVVNYPTYKLYLPDYLREDECDVFNEEELRLYYVACTRAKENLYVL